MTQRRVKLNIFTVAGFFIGSSSIAQRYQREMKASLIMIVLMMVKEGLPLSLISQGVSGMFVLSNLFLRLMLTSQWVSFEALKLHTYVTRRYVTRSTYVCT